MSSDQYRLPLAVDVLGQRSIRNLRLGAGGMVVVLLIFAVVLGWYSWTEEKADAVRNLTTAMELESRAINTYLKHLDLDLRGAGDDLMAQGDPLDLDRAFASIKKLWVSHPELYNVSLIQADGAVLISARSPPGTVVASLAKEPSFVKFLDELKGGTVLGIGQPLIGVVTHVVIVPVRYALKDRDGNLRYVISANLPQAYLQSFWMDAPITAHGAIGLMRDNGFLLSRYPVPPAMTIDQIYGRPRTGVLIQHLQQSGFPTSGFVQGPSSLDGPDFLNVFRRLPDYPVTLFIAMPMAEIRAAWWERVVGAAIVLLLALVGGLLAFRFTLRREHARITEQRRHDDAERVREVRLRTMYSAMIEGLVMQTGTGEIIDANAAAEEILGLKRDQLLGRTSYDPGWRAIREDGSPFPGDEHPAMVTLRTGQSLRDQVMGIHDPTRGLRWISINSRPIAGPGMSEPASVVTTFIDITERRRADQALEESMALLRRSEAETAQSQVLGSTGSWVYNIATNAIRASAQSLAMFAFPPAPKDYSLDDFLARIQDRDRVRQVLAIAISSGQPYDDEFAMNPADGSPAKFIRSLGRVESDAAGKAVRVVGFIQDVTERKTAEAALEKHSEQLESLVQERTAALAASEQRWQFALEGAQQGVWDWDMVGGTVYYSPEYRHMLGYGDEPLDTSAEAGFARFHPDDVAAMTAAVEKHLGGEAPNYSAEFRVRCKDGSYIWVESRGMVVERGSDGRPSRMIGTHADIAERKAAEARIEAQARQLAKLNVDLARRANEAEAANRAKTAFLAMMSHELRTPLNAIMGMTQLAQRRVTEPKVADYLTRAQQASTHLLGIISDILDIARIEVEEISLVDADLTLADVLGRVSNVLGETATGKGLRLDLQVDPSLGAEPLVGDPLRLGQILNNLIGNAIKFTPTGGVSVRVTAAAEGATDRVVRFEVQDTGIGIGPEDQTRLFRTFEQIDMSLTRPFGGTGLGLVIAKRLVDLMGGEIGVISAPGSGSTFWFTARFRKGTQAAVVAATPAGDPAEVMLQRLHAGALVLLVEDEQLNREFGAAQLKEFGLRVDTAEDGEKAVELAGRNDYAAILMDVKTPVTDGIEATRRIRATASGGSVPIIALTALAFPDDRKRCLEAGMNDYLAKPIDAALLATLLLKWIRPRA